MHHRMTVPVRSPSNSIRAPRVALMLFVAFRRSRTIGLVVLAAVVAALVAGVLFARVAHAQRVPTTRLPGPVSTPRPIAPTAGAINYVYLRNGGDTLGVESITHTGASVTGVLSMKGQPRLEWSQTVAGNTMGALSIKVFAPGADGAAAPMQSVAIAARGDSMYLEIDGPQRSRQIVPSKAGALPLVNASVLHAVLLASHARLKSLSAVNVFLTAGGATVPGTLAQGGDTTIFKVGTSDMRVVPAADGMPALILLPGQNARVVRAAGAVSASAGRVMYDAPAGAPYTAEQIRIPTGRAYELAATLTRPVRSAPSPVVVMISGSGPQDRDSRITGVAGYEFFRQIADTLGRRGIAVLRFDDRGIGESGGRESVATATSADFADDVRSIVAWLRTRPDIDGTRIALAGHSEGGAIAPMVAATDAKIKAIALLAGTAYDGRKIIMYQNRQSIDDMTSLTARQRDSIYASVPAQLDSAAKSNPWLAFFMKHDPRVTAKLVKQPVLVMHGMTDRQVTPEQADTLATIIRASGNTDVTLRKLPATNHLFLSDTSGKPAGYPQLKDMKVRADVLGVLADWAARVLK